MVRILASEKHPQARRAVRTGRPPRELAGEVDNRILDAARRVFLKHGLAGASIDEIARLARAGKPTIYARFSTKETLFTAVVMRNVSYVVARFESHAPEGRTIEERLASVGNSILERVLGGDTIDFMRLSIAEARRFPDLASRVHQMACGRGDEAIARLLGEVAHSEGLGTFAPERLGAAAQLFRDLVLFPTVIRALFGENLKLLRAEIGAHVARSVGFFLAACRHSGVD